jgi:tight adherence protein G
VPVALLRADPRRRREIGAIGFATPAVILLAIFVSALAVDVGRLAWNKRQLQEVADLAAIDAMRAFGQCRETSGDPVAAAQASAVRNGYDGNLASAPNKVEIGSVSKGGVREFTAGGTAATATAVRVFATRQVPFTMIASALLPGQATLQAEAVAARTVKGSLSAGSFAARFDTSDSPTWNKVLPPLLGGPVSLSAVSYQGLANATFTVGDLVAAANVGSLDELLDLQLTGPEYLSLLADALSDGGDASAAATLESIAGAVDAGLSVTLGDILDVAAGASDAALDAQLNALDMLAVGAQVARGDAAVSINPLGITVPGVTKATAQLRIVQAPRIAAGYPGKDANGEWNTTVRTGQVRMAITLELTALGLLGNQLVSVKLFVEAAQTQAHLAAIDCADASDPVHHVVVDAEPGLVRLGIGEYPDFNNSPDPVPTRLVGLNLPLFGEVASVTGFADMPFQSAGMDLRFDGPFVPQIDEPSDDNTQTVGTPLGDALSNALDTLLAQTTLTVVPKPPLPPLSITQKNSALTAVTNKLSPVLTALDGPLGAIFDTLGISLGGADITIVSVSSGPKAPNEIQENGIQQPALAR